MSKFLDHENITVNDIGIITPYAAQVEEVANVLPGSCNKVTNDTVDAFQGSERDVIIVSLVRSNASGDAGFLNRPEDGPVDSTWQSPEPPATAQSLEIGKHCEPNQPPVPVLNCTARCTRILKRPDA